MHYRTGDTAYMLENNRNVRTVRIMKFDGNFYTVRFEREGGIRIRESRLYPTLAQARAKLPEKAEPQPRGFRPPMRWGLGTYRP